MERNNKTIEILEKGSNISKRKVLGVPNFTANTLTMYYNTNTKTYYSAAFQDIKYFTYPS